MGTVIEVGKQHPLLRFRRQAQHAVFLAEFQLVRLLIQRPCSIAAAAHFHAVRHHGLAAVRYYRGNAGKIIIPRNNFGLVLSVHDYHR